MSTDRAAHQGAVGFAGQTVNAYLGWSQFVSGDGHDATYRATVTVPLHSEQGTWTLTQVHLGDVVGNQTNISTSALAAARVPHDLRGGPHRRQMS